MGNINFLLGMIEEAERNKEIDKVAKERIDAKNAFESYIFSMKNTIEDPEKLGNKLETSDKEKIKEAVSDAQSWLSGHENGEKEDFEEQQKKLEA